MLSHGVLFLGSVLHHVPTKRKLGFVLGVSGNLSENQLDGKRNDDLKSI